MAVQESVVNAREAQGRCVMYLVDSLKSVKVSIGQHSSPLDASVHSTAAERR